MLGCVVVDAVLVVVVLVVVVVVEVVVVGVFVVVVGAESMFIACVTALAASDAPGLVVVVFGWVVGSVLVGFVGTQHLSAPTPTHFPCGPGAGGCVIVEVVVVFVDVGGVVVIVVVVCGGFGRRVDARAGAFFFFCGIVVHDAFHCFLLLTICTSSIPRVRRY